MRLRNLCRRSRTPNTSCNVHMRMVKRLATRLIVSNAVPVLLASASSHDASILFLANLMYLREGLGSICHRWTSAKTDWCALPFRKPLNFFTLSNHTQCNTRSRTRWSWWCRTTSAKPTLSFPVYVTQKTRRSAGWQRWLQHPTCLMVITYKIAWRINRTHVTFNDSKLVPWSRRGMLSEEEVTASSRNAEDSKSLCDRVIGTTMLQPEAPAWSHLKLGRRQAKF